MLANELLKVVRPTMIDPSKINPMSPTNLDPKTAYVFFSISGQSQGLFIDHVKADGTVISIQKGSSMNQPTQFNEDVQLITIPNFEAGDRIAFYFIDAISYTDELRNIPNKMYKRPSFVGHVYWNGDVYPTNKNNFTSDRSPLINARSLGCHKDSILKKNFQEAPLTMSEMDKGIKNSNILNCNFKARDLGKKYFALSGDKKCYVADSLYDVQSIDQNLCKSDSNALDVYDTSKSLELLECGPSNVANLSHPGTKILRNRVGDGCSAKNMFIYVAFQPDVPIKDMNGNIMKSFCPDPQYAEFNPAGCNDPTSLENCQGSVLVKNGYYADERKCETDLSDYFNNPNIEINISELLQYIAEAYMIGVKKYGINHNWVITYKTNIRKLLGVSCDILGIDTEYFDKNKCLGTQSKSDDLEGTLSVEAIISILKAGKVCRRDAQNDRTTTFANCRVYQQVLKSLYDWARIIHAHIKN
jgi:hypothetical protein